MALLRERVIAREIPKLSLPKAICPHGELVLDGEESDFSDLFVLQAEQVTLPACPRSEGAPRVP